MVTILMLELILGSTLNMAFTIRLSFAKSSENGETTLPNNTNTLDQSNDSSSHCQNIFERKPDAKQGKPLENSGQTSRYSGDGWNFNDTSEWSNFACVDGNKTRLIVGVNGEKPTSLPELERIAGKHQAKIVNLAPNETLTLTFIWNTTGVKACRNYTLTAVTCIPLESNVANNVMESSIKVKVRILGDINGDNKVDLKDVYTIQKAFGLYEGHPLWNPLLDLNGDQKIDLKDVYAVSRHYGKC